MKIWRVENENGEGCYQTKHNLKNWICNRHYDNSIKYPTPCADIKIDRFQKGKEICGFINLKQALNWFSKFELTELMREGFILKEVMVKEITARGKNQVLAVR